MKLGASIFIIGVAAVVGGCRSSVTSVERADPVGSAQVVEDKRVQPDLTLRKKISIVQVNEGVVSGDLAKAQVVLSNRKSHSITVNYAFEWFDRDGLLVNETTVWKPLPLAGKEQKAVTAVAPTPDAVDFVLKIQEPRPFLKRNHLNPFQP